MQKLFPAAILIFLSLAGHAQSKLKVVNSGVIVSDNGQATPDANALVDFNTTQKGLLFPRLTSAQRDAMVGPAEGMVIYNLTIHCIQIFNGTVWIDMCAPGALITIITPTNLVASPSGSTQINLSWTDNSDNETGFEIWYKKQNDSNFSLYSTTSSNISEGSINGLIPETTYVIKIRGIAASFEGEFTDEAFAATHIFEAPTNLATVVSDINQIDLSWSDNTPNEIGFQIERKEGTAVYNLIHTTAPNVTTFIDNSVAANISYTYRVRAIGHDETFYSDYSNEANETIEVSFQWTRRTAPSPNARRGVAWSPALGMIAVVGSSGTGNRVITSLDGINWVEQNSAADAMWHSVSWSPELGLFAAVDQVTTNGQRVMTSPDGINWTLRNTPADIQWTSISWSPELQLFCAVAQSGTNRAMTSPDGITWTIRNIPASTWTTVCWSPYLGMFVAVAQSGTHRIATSPDGINWTGKIHPDSFQLNGVCYSAELNLFVATGAGSKFITSPDGVNWTVRNVPASKIWRRVAWSPEQSIFVATAQDGTLNQSCWSFDGINWEIGATGTQNITWNDVTWVPQLGLFVAVGSSFNTQNIMTGKLVVN